MKHHSSSTSFDEGIALVSVLIFSVVAMIVATAAVSVSVTHLISQTEFLAGQQALHNAQSGAENALLRILRDPQYLGETLTLENGTATITITGTTDKTIEVTGESGNSARTIRVITSNATGATEVTSWQEVF